MKGNLRRILIRPVKHITYAKRRIKTLANHPNSQYLLFFSNRKPIFRRCVHFNAAPHKGRGRPNLQKVEEICRLYYIFLTRKKSKMLCKFLTYSFEKGGILTVELDFLVGQPAKLLPANPWAAPSSPQAALCSKVYFFTSYI